MVLSTLTPLTVFDSVQSDFGSTMELFFVILDFEFQLWSDTSENTSKKGFSQGDTNEHRRVLK